MIEIINERKKLKKPRFCPICKIQDERSRRLRIKNIYKPHKKLGYSVKKIYAYCIKCGYNKTYDNTSETQWWVR